MSMDDIVELENIPPIGPTLADTLDIENLFNIKEISSESHVILDVTNSRTFCELTPGTDLNVPPANWLYPSVNLPNPINIKQINEESTSFYIANMFPECNNKVSMVADAEVIKKLFKIPYNNESVSLMVRKIGNILLIDNFDIANFSGNQEITEETKLSQVEEYLTKLKELNTNLNKKTNNSNKKLRQRNMFSKFLVQSIANDTVVNEESDDLTSADSLPGHSEEVVPVYKFGRIIYWTFEETQMLIGTNTLKQYFLGSGATRNVSLHLSNVEEPLKITSAIDIWLDNLMCDIPEAVICFQLDGIVNQYKYIQTQNIPHLLGSQFSTTKIKASVQGIFSFLLNHEFQRSQNYWLLKYKNNNDLKIFNLNMLEATEDQIQIIKTPFDFEYGRLCYRIGHHQYYSNTEIGKHEWSNTMLLEVSIRTLNRKIHPEIIATSNYLIVHLSFSYEIFKTSLFVKTKAEFQSCKKQPESVTTRCFHALNNIYNGLECLQYFCDSTNTERKILKENGKSNNCFKFNFKSKKTKKQDEVIYINISSLFPKKEHGVFKALPTWQNINEDRDYWKNYLKFLFYHKAELVYGILAQQYFYCDMFGLCLGSLNMMVRSNQIKVKIDPSSHLIPINPVLILAGDCCQSFATVDVPENSIPCNWVDNNVKKMLNMFIADEQYYKIDTNINYDLQVNLMNYTDIKILEKAVAFYKRSLEYEEMDFIRKKLFVSNLALGKLYSDKLYKERRETSSLHNFEQSEKYINEACNDTSCRSPLDQASALFHRAELHDILYSIYLDKQITPYSVQNNLFVHCKICLNSFKDAIQILNTYNGDNEDCIKEIHKYFGSFMCSVTTTLIVWKHEVNNEIPEILLHLMCDCFVSGFKEILKECELSHQRYKDDFLYLLTCAVMKWCIGSFSIKMEEMGRFLNKTDYIKDILHAAITSFIDLSVWKYYILALYEESNYLMDKVLRKVQSNISSSQKIENIKDVLKMFCEAGRNFQKMIDSDFKDAFFPTENMADNDLFNTLMPQFQAHVQNLLNKGIKIIRTDSGQGQELNTFKNCLSMLEYTNIHQDNLNINLFLTTLIHKLEVISIEMKFAL